VPSGDLLPETLSQPTLSAQQPTSKEAKAIKALVTLFDGAKTFGSLITVPDSVMQSLSLLDGLLAKPLTGDLLLRQAQEDAQEALKPLVEQARLLGGRYDCVVANPPYIGGKGMNPRLKKYLQDNYADVKSDVFAAFIVRDTLFAKPNGQLGFMSPFVWMFISSYEKLRGFLLDQKTITSLVQLEYSGFDGATVPICTFTIANRHNPNFKGGYVRLSDFRGSENQAPKTREAIANPNCGWFFRASSTDFSAIPSRPISFSLGAAFFRAFAANKKIGDFGETGSGLQTSDNDRFLRQWFEVSINNTSLNGTGNCPDGFARKWFPHKKGGPYRKWYGNNDFVINWKNNGEELYEWAKSLYGSPTRIIKNTDKYFCEGVTWSHTTSSRFSARILEANFIFNVEAPSLFSNSPKKYLAFLCSNVGTNLIEITNPTLHFVSSSVSNLPFAHEKLLNHEDDLSCIADRCIGLSKADWNSNEFSWDFLVPPLLVKEYCGETLAAAYAAAAAYRAAQVSEMQRLEEENNRRFIDAYGLQDELTPDVPLSEITLTCNPHYRYGGDLTDEEREARLKSDTMRELISYAVGCMMGRYSLAEPGLIYAHAGGVGFDPSRYSPFPADDDGIIPLTEEQWFPDDAAARIEEFLSIAWPEAPVTETMTTLMDGLSMGNAGEPRAALRSYLSKQFYKDHLQTYKNRPIYWLFSSGKHKAFEALVYLHRYNEGTLARMRTVYVTPLMGKLQQRMADLEAEAAASSSSAETTRKNREKDKLAKQVVELRAFDEELRHLADQRIALDLDDGVKVNYARFGSLLAAKDKVCPKKKGEDE